MDVISTNLPIRSKVNRFNRAQKRIALCELNQQSLNNNSPALINQTITRPTQSRKQSRSFIHLDHTYSIQKAKQSQNSSHSTFGEITISNNSVGIQNTEMFNASVSIQRSDNSYQMSSNVLELNTLNLEIKANSMHNNLCELNNPNQTVCLTDTSVQTDEFVIGYECENCNKQEIKIQNLEMNVEFNLNEISELKTQFKRTKMDMDFIKKSNKICNYITGVSSYKVVEIIYSMVEADLP